DMTLEVIAEDNCGYTVSQYPLPYINVGDFDGDTTIVTFTVTDASANTSSCTMVVTIDDTTPPLALCKDPFTWFLGGTGTATININQIDDGSSDDCTPAQDLLLSLTQNSFTCADTVEVQVVALNVQDLAGNFANSCFTPITIRDATAPTITACPPNTTVNCTATIPDMLGQFTATDNCTSSSIVKTQSPAAGSTLVPPGPVTVTFTARDYSGNTSTCSALITVTDPAPPVFTSCPANITVNNDAGTCGYLYNFTAPVATDNCGTPAVTQTSGPVTDSTLPVGATSFTFRATDLAGNTATCSWVVTVRDITLPTPGCQDVTVSLDAMGTGLVTGAEVNDNSTDNCTGTLLFSVIPASFTCTNLGPNTVTLTVTDVNGNTATCTSVVTVQDIIPPTAACRNVMATLDGSGNVTVTAAEMNNGSSDNCGGTLTFLPASVSYTCANTGVQTVSLSVTDANGNTSTCTSIITVQDVTPPVAMCANPTVFLDNTGMVTVSYTQINNMSGDNCGGGLNFSPLSVTYNCSQTGPNPYTLTVTDASGNAATCTATVTVQDNTAPTADCQDVTVTLDAMGAGSVTGAQINDNSTDNCGGALTFSVSTTSFTCSNSGANTVTLTVTDVNSNTATCTAVVTVEDTTPPTVSCADITISLDGDGMVTIAGAELDNGSSDNCPGTLTFSATPSTFTCAQIGAQTVTLTVTDASGNTANCTSTVTVEDNGSPIAVCKNLVVDLDGMGMATVTGSQLDGGSTDGCSGTGTLAFDPGTISYDCDSIGVRIVTLTVTDENGNSSTCTSTVTVRDVTVPSAVCQSQTVQLDNTGNATVAASQINNGSSDECSSTLNYAPASFSYTCTDIGVNNVTLTVSDVSGNTATCTAVVTVQDITPPVAQCKNATVFLGSNGMGSVTSAQMNNNSTDNCGPLTFSPTT
ncbi:MAG: HYR domain-containing protein, partial [Bacteroidota bacterium]